MCFHYRDININEVLMTKLWFLSVSVQNQKISCSKGSLLIFYLGEYICFKSYTNCTGYVQLMYKL